MHRKIRQKIVNLLSLLGMFSIVLLATVNYQQLKRLISASEWAFHSHSIVELTESSLGDLNSIVSAYRAYLLTNNSYYLDSVPKTVEVIDRKLFQLNILAQDNPQQTNQIQEYSQLIHNRLDMLSRVKQLFINGGIPNVKQNTNESDVINKTNQINQLSENIVRVEKNLINERVKSLYEQENRIALVSLAVCLLSLIAISLAILYLNSLIILHKKAEKKLQESEDNLIKLAYYDTLTGVANRTLLDKNIAEAIKISESNNHSIAVLFIDIDHFKNINDSLGHEVGDQLLKLFAERLKKVVSKNDILARLGGDEFVVVLTHVKHMADITSTAQRILFGSSEALIVKQHKLYITASIGISVYPNNGSDEKVLMKNADIAMYRAKEIGRNNYQFCNSEMSIEVEERAKLDYYLHQALIQDEFMLLYQPKISLKNNQIMGVEALVRWNRPNIGLVTPEHFISLAESNGLIIPIGESILRKACLQGIAWQKAGLPELNIAVNVSTRQLALSDYASSVAAILKETGFNPQLLELEITESIFMEKSFRNLDALKSLKELGVQITIDDFGTGFSSLSYLNAFEIDKLKIDQSFINSISTTKPNSSIINAIIVMAHSLNIRVVAEGVEKQEHIDFLIEHNCDEAQGYIYSKPAHPSEIEKIINYLSVGLQQELNSSLPRSL